MTIASWGFAPALAAGNAVVLKPAEWTPLTSLRLAELGLEAGLPDGLFQVMPGKGSVVGERFVTNPDRAQDRVHRLDRGRQAHDGRLRRPGEARHPRARRQERQHRVRRRRPREGRRDRAVRRVRQRRPGLLRPQPDPRGAQRLRPVHGAARAGGAGRRGRRPADEATEMGPLVAAPHLDRVRSFVPDDTDVAFRGAAPVGPGLLVPADRAHARATTAPPREEIFGPVVSVLPFDDEADAIRFANAARTACRARSGPATSAAASAWPVPSSRATSASTRTRRCATRRRSAGSSSRASAASSDPTRRSPSPETKNVNRLTATVRAVEANQPSTGSGNTRHRTGAEMTELPPWTSPNDSPAASP